MSISAPNFIDATGAIARLSMLRVRRGRKVWVAGVATLIIVIFPAIVALSREAADTEAHLEAVRDAVHGGIDWGFFRLLVFLLPLLFTSGTVGEEVEGRTLHYLAMRPVPRASIALGKYVVGVTTSLVIMWLGLMVLHVAGYALTPTLMIDELAVTARAGGALSLLLLVYCAICLLCGTLVPEAGGMLSIVWLGFVEWFVMLLPGVFRFLSMSHWARELGGIERAGLDRITMMGRELVAVPDVELWICAVIPATEWVLVLGLALIVMHTSQLRFGKA